jgi:hypothetical protein
MTEPEETDKPVVQTRTPKKKFTTGIFDNLRKLPAPHPVEEILGLTQPETGPTPSIPSTPSTATTETTPSTTTRPSTPSRQIKAPIAPERNYTKVPNSIVKQGIPTGIFGEQGGKAKELYDTLYSLTRGAVVPRRKIRIPKDKLMKKSGIGSEVTLRKNLVRLRSVKLIKETVVPGAHGGNEYEVFLMEEIGMTGSTPSTPSSDSTGSSTPQMQETVEAVESTVSIPSLSPEETASSSEDKTFSLRPQRTIDDDAALAGLIATIKTTSKEITGKELSASESDRWKELAEVLMAELKIAAARTTISSVPAFMAEHLRRRLWKIDKKQARAEGRELPDEVVTMTPSVDASKCPDCGGSGWWYPEGEAKGVARCKHEKLAMEN